MSHELSSAELAAITRSADPAACYRLDTSVTIVVHDLDALRAAARRAFDHGRFASEQERAAAWAAIRDRPDRLLAHAVDLGRLTEDVPGIIGRADELAVIPTQR